MLLVIYINNKLMSEWAHKHKALADLLLHVALNIMVQ